MRPTTIDTLEKVRSFLGLASYYRRFIQGFSKIAAPLHDLTKNCVDVATMSQLPNLEGLQLCPQVRSGIIHTFLLFATGLHHPQQVPIGLK